MKATTIDNLDIKIHERYAQDQKILDRKYITESVLLSPHFEITGTSSIYSSKWEELFEMHIKNIPWAAFCPPPRYQMQAKRFFSYRILPTIYLRDEHDEEDQNSEDEKNSENQYGEVLKKALQTGKGKKQDSHLFEKDKTAIINMLQSVILLDKLLGQINSRKLQYHKG
jgi:hypothetical protein